MRYAGIIKNDMSAAPGISVSFYAQGCPHRCPGCHNPSTWSFDGGKEFTYETITEVAEALTANGVYRSLAIMGGEPLCDENVFLTNLLISEIKSRLPNTKVYIWSGYYYDELMKLPNPRIKQVLNQCDVLVDGPYIACERDTTLKMRGSTNQSIIDLNKIRENS